VDEDSGSGGGFFGGGVMERGRGFLGFGIIQSVLSPLHYVAGDSTGFLGFFGSVLGSRGSSFSAVLPSVLDIGISAPRG
jgi:hypothetical protein